MVQKTKILIIAASDRIVGGHSVQAKEMAKQFNVSQSFKIRRFHIDTKLPNFILKIKYLRTLINEACYIIGLSPKVLWADVLHIFSASYWSFLLGPAPAIVLGQIFKRKVILNYHSGEADDHLSKWKGIVRLFLRLADEIVVPSVYLRDIFCRHGFEAKVIPNAVDINRFHIDRSDDDEPLRILCTRNFEDHYGVDQVMKVFSKIKAEIPDARLILVGDGPEAPKLKRLAQEFHLKDVVFAGQVDHDAIPDFYKKANFFLNASTVDNMPLSLLEAMAAGLIVVSTASGGIPYMIKSPVNGVLVDKEGAESLAMEVIKVYRDKELWKNIRYEAVNYSQEFSPDKIGRQWEALYGSLCI